MAQLLEAQLVKVRAENEAGYKREMLLLEELQKDKIVDVNSLITDYHIRKSQLSKAAQKMLATRKSKAGNAAKTKKKTSKKSGNKKVTTSKNSTANTA